MFTIYGILVDVMRLGVGPDEEAKQDVQLSTITHIYGASATSFDGWC
jgi:hypothetical protein